MPAAVSTLCTYNCGHSNSTQFKVIAIYVRLYIKNITVCSNHRHFLCFFQDIELSLVLLLWPQQYSTHVQKYSQEKAEERCHAVSLSSRMVLHTNANPGLAMGTNHSLAGIVHQNCGLVMDHAHRGRRWWRHRGHLRRMRNLRIELARRGLVQVHLCRRS